MKYKGRKTLTDDQKEGLDEALELLNTFLQNSKWVAGENITIADFSLIAGYFIPDR